MFQDERVPWAHQETERPWGAGAVGLRPPWGQKGGPVRDEAEEASRGWIMNFLDLGKRVGFYPGGSG